MIDRIYDTFIDEEELRICDETTHQITNSLEPRPYSSREFIREMGAYLAKNGKTPQAGGRDSIVLAAYEKNVPIFCPAFSDCSAGFGLVAHQHERQGKPHVSIDSAKDFYEITQLKIANPTTGLLMIGGGVPKNFAQDIVVAADILGVDASMHKYAIQITVADARDGALSGSTQVTPSTRKPRPPGREKSGPQSSTRSPCQPKPPPPECAKIGRLSLRKTAFLRSDNLINPVIPMLSSRITHGGVIAAATYFLSFSAG
jgi:hypothetical protein